MCATCTDGCKPGDLGLLTICQLRPHGGCRWQGVVTPGGGLGRHRHLLGGQREDFFLNVLLHKLGNLLSVRLHSCMTAVPPGRVTDDAGMRVFRGQRWLTRRFEAGIWNDVSRMLSDKPEWAHPQ